MRKTFAITFMALALCGLIVPTALGDGPNVRSYYTSALDDLEVTYDVWDVATQGDPSANHLIGYRIVLWFTGYPRRDTFTSANEATVASYLDAQGRFWLVSEDYLYDRGLTSFGQERLRIWGYTNDVNHTDPEGVEDSPGAGLGPYTLVPPDGWPGELYTDDVVRWSG